ncbi:MAG: sensor histidine kinase, partial [Rhodobacterales bacterium]
MAADDDWGGADGIDDKALHGERKERSRFSLNRSPLTRKIITFNLLALNVLVAGILYINSSRDTLAAQRANSMQSEIELIADVFEAQLLEGTTATLGTPDGIDVIATLNGMQVRAGVEVMIFDAENVIVGKLTGTLTNIVPVETYEHNAPTLISDFLNAIWARVPNVFGDDGTAELLPIEETLRRTIEQGDPMSTRVNSALDGVGDAVFSAMTPIRQGNTLLGTVAMVSAALEIDAAVRSERERVLEMFVIATLVSIGLSLVLASTIANPISDLADAAEIGRDRNMRNKSSGRIRIPDLTARPDEIGRLSGALRSMVAAMYDRIDSNEQFAADVAHEIKNPLASLRSAVGSLRMIRTEEHRIRLLDVIEHDVRRLDRLVSDISNASRLDSELVKEEEERFNLLDMVRVLAQYMAEDAKKKGIEFIIDLPQAPIEIQGLEPRLAQVFVNL